MQVLGQNSNGAHDRLANIKVFRSRNDAVDYYVDFPAEHLVQRMVQTWFGDAVPRQDQLRVGTLKHCGEQSQRKLALAPSSHAHLQNIKHSDCSDFHACLVKLKRSVFDSCPNDSFQHRTAQKSMTGLSSEHSCELVRWDKSILIEYVLLSAMLLLHIVQQQQNRSWKPFSKLNDCVFNDLQASL